MVPTHRIVNLANEIVTLPTEYLMVVLLFNSNQSNNSCFPILTVTLPSLLFNFTHNICLCNKNKFRKIVSTLKSKALTQH